MKTQHIRKAMASMVILTIVLLPAWGVNAAGSDSIYGDAYGYVIKYSNARLITQDTDDTVGPSVAFKQTYGPADLQLAAAKCNQTNIYWDGFYHQAIGALRTVADGIPAGYYFCIATYSYPSSGEFGGTLWWD